MEQYLEILQKCPLFAGVPEAELPGLLAAAGAQIRRYGTGSVLLQAGETAERFGIVLAGAAQLWKEDYQGNRALLARLEPGEPFAEVFACLGTPLTVTAEAAGETAVLWLPYVSIASRGGQLCENLLRSFAAKNLFLTGRIEHLSKRTLRQKALSYLSEQSLRAGSRSFRIPLNRQELADYLAADRSALSAVLSSLREEGVLTFHKNRFTLL